jgi:predicted transcriptional regulator
MTPQLTPEQSDALHLNGDKLEVVDPATKRVYVLVDPAILERAKALLAQNEQENLAGIQQGVADMEAGRLVSPEESQERVRQHLQSKYGV